MTTAPLQHVMDERLASLQGLAGWQVFWRPGGAEWAEAARHGALADVGLAALLDGFDPQAGGQVAALAQTDAAWLATYQTAGPRVALYLLLTLHDMPAAALPVLLDRIAAAVGWVLVAAETTVAAQHGAETLSQDMGAALLLAAARARDRAQLADQWIARLEQATGAEAVCICWVRADVPRLVRLSGGGLIAQPSDARSGVEALVAAAISQRGPVIAPGPDGAHAAALSDMQAGRAVAIPVYDDGICGAGVVLLWRAPEARIPSAAALDLYGAVLGETLLIQNRAHPSILRRLGNWGGNLLRALFGPRRVKTKLALVALMAAVVAAALVPTRFNPGFAARIEARDRAIAAAPFDGFVQVSAVQLGDLVEPGQILFEMDVTELRLDLEEQRADGLRLASELNVARAARDTATVRRLLAEQDQVRIRTDLLAARIAQGVVRAAAPGVVVAGDAWRRQGARVRLGDPLVELARPDGLAVLGFVTEDWVADLAPGARAELTLTAFPDRMIPARLDQITPASRDEDGQVAFLTWFLPDLPADQAITDGMRGRLKVEGPPTTYLNRYGRDLFRWVRRQIWVWG